MTAIYKVTYKDKEGVTHKEMPINAASTISACSRMHKLKEGNIVLACHKGQHSSNVYTDGMIHYPEVAGIFRKPYKPPLKAVETPPTLEFGFVDELEGNPRS